MLKSNLITKSNLMSQFLIISTSKNAEKHSTNGRIGNLRVFKFHELRRRKTVLIQDEQKLITDKLLTSQYNFF